LCAGSGYLKALLTGGLKESSQKSIELKEVDTAPFLAVLKFIYTDGFDLSVYADILIDVFLLASRFDVISLKSYLEKIIMNNISAENVVSLLQVVLSSPLY